MLSVLSVAYNRVLAGEVDDPVDVIFKWWAANPVGSEQLLRLRRVVELLHEEIRHGVMRQTRDLRRWW